MWPKNEALGLAMFWNPFSKYVIPKLGLKCRRRCIVAKLSANRRQIFCRAETVTYLSRQKRYMPVAAERKYSRGRKRTTYGGRNTIDLSCQIDAIF
jgi:hypothetical protein